MDLPKCPSKCRGLGLAYSSMCINFISASLAVCMTQKCHCVIAAGECLLGTIKSKCLEDKSHLVGFEILKAFGCASEGWLVKLRNRIASGWLMRKPRQFVPRWLEFDDENSNFHVDK